jgi:hypothetical protein
MSAKNTRKAALAVKCPACGARPDEPCIELIDRPDKPPYHQRVHRLHPERVAEAQNPKPKKKRKPRVTRKTIKQARKTYPTLDDGSKSVRTVSGGAFESNRRKH